LDDFVEGLRMVRAGNARASDRCKNNTVAHAMCAQRRCRRGSIDVE
jgi:hypothetical protein